LIEAGADAVLSNHTHCYSGYEVYKGKPIFYGLGNFVYDSPGRINKEWNKGYVVRLFLADNIRYEIIPLKQCNDMPGVFHLDKQELVEFYRIIEERNQIISDDIKLEKAFQHYTEQVFTMYDAFIEPYFGRVYNAMRQRGFIPNLLQRKKRLLLLNLTRCEAHREVLVRLLNKYE
jgi:poly-gamma-glutamate synthesis protein (capsule biosynthesis protein)